MESSNSFSNHQLVDLRQESKGEKANFGFFGFEIQNRFFLLLWILRIFVDFIGLENISWIEKDVLDFQDFSQEKYLALLFI